MKKTCARLAFCFICSKLYYYYTSQLLLKRRLKKKLLHYEGTRKHQLPAQVNTKENMKTSNSVQLRKIKLKPYNTFAMKSHHHQHQHQLLHHHHHLYHTLTRYIDACKPHDALSLHFLVYKTMNCMQRRLLWVHNKLLFIKLYRWRFRAIFYRLCNGNMNRLCTFPFYRETQHSFVGGHLSDLENLIRGRTWKCYDKC